MLRLIESQSDSRCQYLTDNECKRIVEENMLIQSADHFYVRKGELMENFHSAMRSALKKLAKLAPSQEYQDVEEPNWNKSPMPRKTATEEEVMVMSEDEEPLADSLTNPSLSPPPSLPVMQPKPMAEGKEERWTSGNGEHPTQKDGPIFGKVLESGDLSRLNRDDEILHGDPIGTQLSLGVKVEESEEEEDEE